MTVPHAYASSAADVIARLDFWRRSPASVGGAAGHKEWSYFSILDNEVQIVTAFSIMDCRSANDEGTLRVEEARLTLLVRTSDGRWDGDLQLCSSSTPTVTAGAIDASFGANRLAFDGESYRIAIESPRHTVDLVLRPVARPALTRSVPLGRTDPMHWFVVPRLEAAGNVRVGHRHVRLVRSPAYHDHNWGRFQWGGDFAWEWAIALSSGTSEWSLVYYRITDRGRHTVRAQGLLIWAGDRHCRTFRDAEIAVVGSGFLRAAGCLRLPSVMRMAVAGAAADIPARLHVTAASDADSVDLVFALSDCAQVGVPDDAGDGITIISECHARASARGCLNGRALAFECHSVLEFNRGAA